MILVALVPLLTPDLMMLNARSRSIRMHKLLAIHPGSSPRTAINQDGVFTPSETEAAPSPGSKRSNGDARSKSNRGAHSKARPRPRKDNVGVVVGHKVHTWIDRNDFDVA